MQLSRAHDIINQRMEFYFTLPSRDGERWLVVEAHSRSCPVFIGKRDDALQVADALNERACEARAAILM